MSEVGASKEELAEENGVQVDEELHDDLVGIVNDETPRIEQNYTADSFARFSLGTAVP